MSSAQLYDTIGATYPVTRRTEPRIAAQIWAALGDARTVLNVGAGTGSYEPPDRYVLAVEPSALMRAQRPPDAAPCLAGAAEDLPFDDQSFDAAMAVCTVHHWRDPVAGLREMRRVARRVVVFLFDTSDADQFWLTRDYLPEVASLSGFRVLAALPDAGRRDRRRDGTGDHPLGLRRRLLRGLLAPARGLPGRARQARHLGLGRGRAGGRAACRSPASAPTSRQVGGPNATALSWTSRKPSSALAC